VDKSLLSFLFIYKKEDWSKSSGSDDASRIGLPSAITSRSLLEFCAQFNLGSFRFGSEKRLGAVSSVPGFLGGPSEVIEALYAHQIRNCFDGPRAWS
jgi:hypothetical protein